MGKNIIHHTISDEFFSNGGEGGQIKRKITIYLFVNINFRYCITHILLT